MEADPEPQPPPRKKRNLANPTPQQLWPEQVHTAFVKALQLQAVREIIHAQTMMIRAQRQFERIMRENAAGNATARAAAAGRFVEL